MCNNTIACLHRILDALSGMFGGFIVGAFAESGCIDFSIVRLGLRKAIRLAGRIVISDAEMSTGVCSCEGNVLVPLFLWYRLGLRYIDMILGKVIGVATVIVVEALAAMEVNIKAFIESLS